MTLSRPIENRKDKCIGEIAAENDTTEVSALVKERSTACYKNHIRNSLLKFYVERMETFERNTYQTEYLEYLKYTSRSYHKILSKNYLTLNKV